MTKPTAPVILPSLKLMAENHIEGITKNTTFRIDPNLIQFEKGFNLREETPELIEHIDRIYNAMKAGASIPPVDVMVENGKVLARDGHCRTRAARRLRKEQPEYTLECRQLRGNEVDALFHMLGTGTGSKPLSPLEAGLGYLRAIKMGLTNKQIADRLGVSVPTIVNGLALAEAPLEVQKMISAGDVSATTARDAIKQGPEGVAALKEAVEKHRATPTKKKNGKKAKVTAKKLRGTKAEKKPKKRKEKTTAPASSVPAVPPVETPTSDPNTVSVTVSRETATAVFEYLRDFGGTGNAHLDTMKSTLETALL